MGFWNYRLVKHKEKDGDDDYLAIHEAYYDDNGSISSITTNPVTFGGNSFNKVYAVVNMVEKDLAKFHLETLNEEDFEGENITEKLKKYTRMKKIMQLGKELEEKLKKKKSSK